MNGEARRSWPRRAATTAWLVGRARYEGAVPYWSPERLERLQRRRLRSIVRHAYKSVPVYRDAMDERGLRPLDFATVDDLARLPLIDARDVRGDVERYTSTRLAAQDRHELSSSGTSTSSPGSMFWDHSALLRDFARSARDRVVLDDLAGERHVASVARDLVARASSRSAPAGLGDRAETHQRISIFPPSSNVWELRRLWGQLTLVPAGSAHHHFVDAPFDFEDAIERFNAVRPRVAYSHGSYADHFLRYVRARAEQVALPRVWVVGADMVSSAAREVAGELGCTLYSTYSAVEAGRLGFQCEHLDGYHLNVDACAVRIVDRGGRSVPQGQTGEIVISNLSNRATVLLNFALGDRGVLDPSPCQCGRSLPLLARLDGRRSDVIRLRGEREISSLRLDDALKTELKDTVKAQIAQDEAGRVVLRVVPVEGTDRDALRRAILERADRELGDALTLQVEFVADIPATPGGKFRSVVPL